jgi:hypothetical protein
MPTFVDVVVLTGLNISATHKLKIKVGGWNDCITEHARTWTTTDREHVAFLNCGLRDTSFVGKLAVRRTTCNA